MIWAVVIAVGETNAQAAAGKDTAGLVFAQAGHYLGPWAELVMYLLILTSVYASQLAFHNAINRYTYSLARDRVLPRILHRTNPKTGSPYVSGIVQTVLAVVVVGIFAIANGDPYLQLLLWVNSPGVLGIILLQVITCVAVVVFFVRRRDLPRAWYVIPCAVVAGIAQIVVLYVLCSSIDLLTSGGPVVDTIVLAAIPITFLVGVILAVVWKRTRPDVYAGIGGSAEEDPADAVDAKVRATGAGASHV